MNTLDIMIGALCLGSAILGAALGPLRQIFKLGGLVLGLVLAKRYFVWAQDVMHLRFVHGDAVAYVILLLAVYSAARLVGYAVEYSLRGEKLSGSERLTGGLVGLVHGAVLSIVAVFILVAVSPREAPLVRESKAASPAIAAGWWAQAVFPREIRDPFREKAPAAKGEGEKEKEKAGKKVKEGAPAAPVSPQPKNRPRK